MAPLKDKKMLATKEQTILRRSIAEYDSGKYKASLKGAEQILKKYPDHGETLAIKGLCLSQLERRAEAVDVAKRGLRQDLTSFLCWHALAICQRKDRNYEEALKCYMQAARLEPTNVNMYREIALMHVMLRQHAPVIEQRLKVLKVQSHLRLNWTQLAISHHLAGSLNEAARVLDSYEDTIKSHPDKSFEHSETILYHALILEEAGRYQEALDKLDQNSKAILDIKAKDELRARCCLSLKKIHEAAVIFRSLLERNQNTYAYLEGYLEAKGVLLPSSSSAGKLPESSNQSNAIEVIEDLERSLPSSAAVKRVALQLLHGDEFRKRLEAYIVRNCQKGVPSLFSSLKRLYDDEKKKRMIEKVAEARRQAWQPRDRAASSSSEQGERQGGEEQDEEPPSTYLWCLYLLAQHYTFTGQHERALAYIDSALAHTPTMPELHMTRARILKRSGDLLGAAHAADDARLLDGQDRYLNCKAAKYALRIDDVESAVKLVGLFTKQDVANPVVDLFDMQAFWYLSEEAQAHLRLGNYQLALKRLSQIDSVINDMWNDQLDFHGYCIRKFTLRSYVQSIRFADQIRTHEPYVQAALRTVELCCKMHDEPALKMAQLAGRKSRLAAIAASSRMATNGAATHGPTTNGAVANGTVADAADVKGAEGEAKKQSNKSKKAEAKAKAEAARQAAASAAGKATEAKDKKKDDEEEVPQPPQDQDPDGVQQLADLAPLTLARNVCRGLQTNVPGQIETWLATFEWAVREKNWLAAARAIIKAHCLDSAHHQLHVNIIRLQQLLPDLSGAPEPVQDSIRAALSSVISSSSPSSALVADGKTLDAFNVQYLQAHSENALRVLGAAKGLLHIHGDARKSDVAEYVLRLPKLASSSKASSLQGLIDGQEFLRSISGVDGDAALLREYNDACRKLWPRANAFKSDEELSTEASERATARQRWEAVKHEDREDAPTDAW